MSVKLTSKVREYGRYESKLMQYLKDMVHWQNVLCHLGIEHKKCQSVLEKHRDPNVALKECLLHWANGNVKDADGTWDELFEALKLGDEAGVASDLEQNIFGCGDESPSKKDSKLKVPFKGKKRATKKPKEESSASEIESDASDYTPSKKQKCNSKRRSTRNKQKSMKNGRGNGSISKERRHAKDEDINDSQSESELSESGEENENIEKDKERLREIKLDGKEHRDILQCVIVEELSGKWKDFANGLSFSANKVDNLESQYSKDKDRLMKTLDEWSRQAKSTGRKPRNAKTVYDVLVNMGCQQEATALLNKFRGKFTST